jgi:hypothetical protein
VEVAAAHALNDASEDAVEGVSGSDQLGPSQHVLGEPAPAGGEGVAGGSVLDVDAHDVRSSEQVDRELERPPAGEHALLAVASRLVVDDPERLAR